MPSADAPAPGGPHAWGLSLPDRPILLVDIDRLLETSADVELLGRSGPIRIWRDALTVVLELLTYARTILDADVAILRGLPAAAGRGGAGLVDVLPRILARESDDDWSEPDRGADGRGAEDMEIDANFFTWSEELTSAHQAMARIDLSSPADVARTLAAVEKQLTALTERQEAVEARLQRIRRALVREYQEEAAPARDRPA